MSNGPETHLGGDVYASFQGLTAALRGVDAHGNDQCVTVSPEVMGELLSWLCNQPGASGLVAAMALQVTAEKAFERFGLRGDGKLAN